MKHKLLLLVFIVLGVFQLNSQITVQGTIKSEGDHTVNVYVQPSALISQPMGAPAGFNITISIPAISGTPPTAIATTGIPGTTVNVLPVYQLDGRHMYTYTLTGNSSAAINWPASSENLVLSVDFAAGSETTGLFPRLEDETMNGGGTGAQSYFYADFNGIDYTNYAAMFYGNTGNDSDGDQFVTSASPLPIKLSTFFATKDGERAVRLDWISKSEVNSSHFGIERSVDGINDFVNIGRVAAAGNSNSEIKYDFIDANLPLNRDNITTLYYRLEQVDVDGFAEYSEIRSVSFDPTQKVTVTAFPNPTANTLFVEMSAPESKGEATLQMMDAAGRLVTKRTISANGVTEINVSDFNNGAYSVRVDYNGQVYNHKIIKTN